MKRILLALTFIELIACNMVGFAQTAPPAEDTAPASTTTPNVVPQPAVPTNEIPAVAVPAPADTNAPAQPAIPVSTSPVAEEAPTPPGGPQTNTLAQLGTLIPLIVMDEVPLTDAIRNLARQADINYQIDPKIGFGQVGPDGKRGAQPIVSIRWEYITAEQALNALLNNYSLQLVEDPKYKIASIKLKDPAALPPLTTKIVQLKYASPSNIVASVQAVFVDPKRSKVMTDNRTSQVVIVATEKEMETIKILIDGLDKPTRQVLIETRLIETSMNPTTKKGVDWKGTLDRQNVTFGNGVTTGTGSSQNSSGSTVTRPGTPVTSTTTLPGGRQVTTTTTPASDSSSAAASSVSSVLNSVFGNNAGFSLNTASGITPNVGFLNADGVRVALSFLNTYAESKVLSSPRTVTLDNEESHIEVGTMFPIVNTTAGTANTTGGSQVTYSNLTVSLKVTPRISENNYVNLRVSPNITRLGPLVRSVVGGVDNAVYEFLTRKIETRVMIPSGNTLVMGGLIQDESNSSNTKVPILGDIPVLGYLFRLDTKDRNKQNLIIFITPTIIQDEDFQPTKTTFLKNPVPVKDSVEDDWSAWDSGKPKDWSKKAVPQATPTFDETLGQPGTPAKQ
ncbi:MAG: hypothetical protein NT154_36725 [Verrucomicrobia bacterium]|nr:hypothetical protein [Verrucomicrobiota bacterium]